ncbi:Hypothetical predicted protein [Marmota monax]|uniref:Uncharacterized protein n=1 Tax=Marmota monax TaxID=9995 RepID=A0A5E4C999_MARMO|nr:Hypothetical predicted protein [Marmota monax]
MLGNSECPFFLWGLLAFLGLALVISLIFNISHYVEKQRQGYRLARDYPGKNFPPPIGQLVKLQPQKFSLIHEEEREECLFKVQAYSNSLRVSRPSADPKSEVASEEK